MRAAGIVKLVGRYVFVLAVASVVIFAMMRAVPGNPARVALGINATDDAVAELSATLGLDQPLIAQYADWMGGLLRGDFGVSLASQTSITAQVLDRAQVSLILVGLALLLALAIAVPLGIASARYPGLSVLSQLGIALPNFLIGLLLINAFGRWLPTGGWVPPNQGFGDFVAHLILPVVSLALVQAAMLTRYVRAAVREVMGQDYIRTARALGASPTRALIRHGLRNAALPVLTVAGVQLTTLVIGAVVIESVFVVPGLGSMLLDAVANRDLTTVQTLVMLLVAFTLTVNLLVDVAYRLIDPRLAGGRAGARPSVKEAA